MTSTQPSVEILLIDDDEDDFFLAQDYLSEFKEKHYILHWEQNTNQALEAMTENRYSLYLVDYRLGDKTGLELLEKARASGCIAPIIMLTGKGDQAIDEQSMKAGASDYLVKSQINADLLERSIRYSLERYENQHIILEQEQKYRSLFEQSMDAIYFTDENEYIRNANAYLVKMLQYTRSELYDMRVEELFLEKDSYRGLKKELDEIGFVKGFEAKLKKKDGKPVSCLISSSVILDHAVAVKGYQAILHDISPMKKAELEIRIAEKLSLTGRMARMIAHEVRNPLTNINLSLEEIKEILHDNQEVQLYIDIIKRNSTRINELITKLLESSKIQGLQLMESDPNELIQETLSLCQDRINLLEIKLNVDLVKEKLKILLDKEKIKIAFLNIFTNAIEALEGRTSPEISISTTMDGKNFIARFADNGVGMSPENINRIFEPFYTSKKSGMGLGMTSTKSILNSHQIHIDVESTPDKGTAFILTFPIDNSSLMDLLQST